jgi:hypothetical protein
MRMLMLGMLLFVATSSTFAVSSMATAFAIPVSNGVVAIVSIYGEMTQLTANDGKVTYDSHGRITDVGILKVSYDSRARVNKIDAAAVEYDARGRISKIGAIKLDYDPRGRVANIGNAVVSYDSKSRVVKLTGDEKIDMVLSFTQ